MGEKRVVNINLEMTPEEYRKFTDYQNRKNESVEIVEEKEKLNLPPAEIKGEVRKKKKSKFFGKIFKEDFGDVFKYVVIPNIIDFLAKASKNSIDMLFYGEVDKYDRDRDRRSSRVSYNRYYDDYERRRDNRRRDREREEEEHLRFEYDQIEYGLRADAEDICTKLINTLHYQDGIVSINDYYDIIKEANPQVWNALDICPDFTHAKWGWTDLRSAKVEPAGGGYWRIKLPRPVQLN